MVSRAGGISGDFGPQGSLALARAFLEHYDARNRDDLGGGNLRRAAFFAEITVVAPPEFLVLPVNAKVKR